MQINDRQTSWKRNNIHEQLTTEAKQARPGMTKSG
jgi:hypothetical protein